MKNIRVGNLNSRTTRQNNPLAFRAVWNRPQIQMVMDNKTRLPRGFAFVEMIDSDAGPVIATLNGRIVDGPDPFHEGDEIVLVEGTYQGTLSVFVRLRDDVGWEDIAERNGAVRSHPVAWIGHAVEDSRSSVRVAAAGLEARV